MICRVDGVECGRSFFKAIRSVVVVIVPVSVISSVVVRIVIRGSGVVAVVMIRAIPRSLAASPRRISVISSIVEVILLYLELMPPLGMSVLRCVRLLRIFKVSDLVHVEMRQAAVGVNTT